MRLLNKLLLMVGLRMMGVELCCSLLLAAHPARTAAIDQFCASVRAEFAEAMPAYFAGPDPWEKLDHPADACKSQTLSSAGAPVCAADGVVMATVFQEGRRVKWVILQIQAPDDGWFETTQYFFDEEGAIQKRERHLDQYSSHIQLEEDHYFHNRKVIRTNYHDALLSVQPALGEKEDWNAFYDPQAPFYTGTDMLPGKFVQVEVRHLAEKQDFLRSNALSSLLRFNRPVVSGREQLTDSRC